jgi:hypothetical protein
MKLSEVKTDGNLKILLYGLAGTGKTCFAAGFPTPILYLDFDNKVDSAALFHKKDQVRLEGIDVRPLAPTLSQSPIAELEKIITNELIPQQKAGEMKYKTLVVDSLTIFSAATLKYIVETNPGIKRPVSKQGQQPTPADYGILKREFAKLIPGLLSLPMNVIMLGHISTERDETTGEIIRGTMLDGSFGKELPIYFKEVWVSRVDDKGQFWAQTKSDGKYSCRSQIPGLPALLKLEYAELAKYL